MSLIAVLLAPNMLRASNMTRCAVLRRNIVTDDWVVFASSRRGHPNQFRKSKQVCVEEAAEKGFQSADPNTHSIPSHLEGCPFCPGNEALLIPGGLVFDLDAGRNVMVDHPVPGAIMTPRDIPHRAWATRVVKNKYPAVAEPKVDLEPSVGPSSELSSLKETEEEFDNNQRVQRERVEIPAFGHHEVVIESKRHNDRTELNRNRLFDPSDALLQEQRGDGRCVATTPTLSNCGVANRTQTNEGSAGSLFEVLPSESGLGVRYASRGERWQCPRSGSGHLHQPIGLPTQRNSSIDALRRH